MGYFDCCHDHTFLWNNSDSSHFIHLFCYCRSACLSRDNPLNWSSKELGAKKKNFIWHFVQKSVHTLVPSGNKVHTPWPLKNKEVVHMHKPLFSVSSWGSQFRSYCGKLKHSPRERCVTDFLFQKDWLSFQNCWETLVQEIPHVCNLDFTHGKDFI